jgi:hypothetical protein
MDSASCSDEFSCPTPASVNFDCKRSAKSGRLASFEPAIGVAALSIREGARLSRAGTPESPSVIFQLIVSVT